MAKYEPAGQPQLKGGPSNGLRRNRKALTSIPGDYTLRMSLEVRDGINDHTVVFLQIGEGVLYEGNATASRMWKLLKDGRTVDRVAEAVAAELDAPLDVVKDDLAQFVQWLHEKKITEDQPITL